MRTYNRHDDSRGISDKMIILGFGSWLGWMEWVQGRPRGVGIDSSVSTYSFTNYHVYLALAQASSLPSQYHTTLKYLGT